jgi:hypothetical protein
MREPPVFTCLRVRIELSSIRLPGSQPFSCRRYLPKVPYPYPLPPLHSKQLFPLHSTPPRHPIFDIRAQYGNILFCRLNFAACSVHSPPRVLFFSKRRPLRTTQPLTEILQISIHALPSYMPVWIAIARSPTERPAPLKCLADEVRVKLLLLLHPGGCYIYRELRCYGIKKRYKILWKRQCLLL